MEYLLLPVRVPTAFPVKTLAVALEPPHNSLLVTCLYPCCVHRRPRAESDQMIDHVLDAHSTPPVVKQEDHHQADQNRHQVPNRVYFHAPTDRCMCSAIRKCPLDTNICVRRRLRRECRCKCKFFLCTTKSHQALFLYCSSTGLYCILFFLLACLSLMRFVKNFFY